MRVILAAFISAFIGLIQLLVIFAIESQRTDEKSGALASDFAFFVFSLLVLAEIISVIALSMYRLSPWMLRLLRDDWEARRVSEAKRRYGAVLQHVAVYSALLRRVVVMVDAGSYSNDLLLSLGVAMLPFLVPRLSAKKRPNQTPEPTPLLVTDRADARSAPSKGVAHL